MGDDRGEYRGLCVICGRHQWEKRSDHTTVCTTFSELHDAVAANAKRIEQLEEELETLRGEVLG